MSVKEEVIASISEAIETTVQELESRAAMSSHDRNVILAGYTRLAINCGFKAGIVILGTDPTKHEPSHFFLVYIDFPSGQVGWHVHVNFISYFEGIPTYDGKYDGHSNKEKHHRTMYPITDSTVNNRE